MGGSESNRRDSGNEREKAEPTAKDTR
jgi:hypothetical protein